MYYLKICWKKNNNNNIKMFAFNPIILNYFNINILLYWKQLMKIHKIFLIKYFPFS